MADIKKKVVVEKADTHGHDPHDQMKTVGDQDTNPRINRAEKSLGQAGVKTPWLNSHEVVKGAEPYWQSHHANSQGLSGQTDWQHHGAKRGDTKGPDQHENPWYGINTNNTDSLDQTH